MRALLDVNVLIALLDSDHSSHRRATDWFAENAEAGWASCPITQNACVRIMSHSAYPNSLPVNAIAGRLREAAADALHEFWADDVSLLDEKILDPERIHGARQVTDAYLLALAVQRGGRLVTFDGGISRAPVRKAEKRHLTVL